MNLKTLAETIGLVILGGLGVPDPELQKTQNIRENVEKRKQAIENILISQLGEGSFSEGGLVRDLY